MPTDTLNTLLKDIKAECERLHITLYNGRIDDASHPVVYFSEFEDGEWKDYLASFQKAGAKLLILTTRINDLGPFSEKADPHFTAEENEEIAKDNKLLNETRGQLAYFTLSFFEDGACFQYEKWADWALPYQGLFLEPIEDRMDYEFIRGNIE